MEKPFAHISRKPLAAPFEDMEEIVIATLNSMQFRNLNYVDTPKTIQATKDDTEVWANHNFKKSYAIEVNWYEDLMPPPQFQELAKENEFIQPLHVSVRLKDLRSDAQDSAQEMLKSFWNQLKERAAETSEAAKVRKKPTDHGTASWATLEELRKEDYLHDETSEDQSRRLLLGSYKGHQISVPKRFTEAHAVVAGPPGSGKSTTIFIPNLINRLNTSAIVTEVTGGENKKPVVYKTTAGFRQANGHKVYYINPSDLDNCTRFNPIDFIEGLDDAIYYADLIISNTTEKTHIGDQIWKQSETHLLTALLLYAWGLGGKTKSVEGGLSNLGHVRSLLRYGPVNLNKHIAKNGIPLAQRAFDEFIRNSSPNFRLGVFSGLIQRLNIWNNPKLIKLTEVSDFTIDDLANNLFTFYLAYPVNRRDFKPVMALALNFLSKLAMRPTQFKHPLTLLLDEFAAFGRIDGIDTVQATVRNSEIGIVLGFQDKEQLMEVYTPSQAENFFTNADTKLLFGTGSIKAQQYISQLLSRQTRVKKQISSSGHITKQTYGAPLMEPGEVGTRIQRGQSVVVRNMRNPVHIDMSAFDKYASYEKDYPAPQKPKKQIDPKIFDDVEEADKLQYSEDEADSQISMYEKLWKAKVNAEEKVDLAKQEGISGQKIKTLEHQMNLAIAAYDKFVEPEGPPPTPKEGGAKEIIPKPAKSNLAVPPVVTVPEPEEDELEVADPVTATPKPVEEGSGEPQPDAYEGLYAEGDDDLFAKHYVDEASDEK